MKKAIITLTVVGLPLITWAGTDVGAKMDQLRVNMENSEENYNQYKKNLEISTQNVIETTNAVKELRKQKKNLLNSSQDIAKNKKVLEQMKTQLQEYKKFETAKLQKEAKQIQELEAVLAKLKNNQKQRELNLAAYDQKIQEIEQEKQDWDLQKANLADIKAELETKEKLAMEQREEWIGKKKGYRTEAIKWHKEKKDAEESYTKLDKLRQ